MGDIPQEAPWQIATALSVVANVGQMLLGWRKTRSEVGRVDIDIDKIRQDLVIELIEKNRELRDEMLAQNDRRIAQLKTALVEAKEESTKLRARVADLEQALADSENARQKSEAEMGAMITSLEMSIKGLGTAFEVERHMRIALENELNAWRNSGQQSLDERP